MLIQLCLQHRQKCLCHALMYQTGLKCIADTRSLRLTVVSDLHCHRKIRCLIHINMTVTRSCLDNRKCRIPDNCPDQSCSSSRNQNIDQTVGFHHLCGNFPGCILHKLYNILRKTTGCHCPTHSIHQHLVRADCLLAATQDCCVTTLNTK